jgi:methionine--tRNA ligase beta chain
VSETVSFEEWSRLDIRIGRVLEAARIPGSRKLLKLRLDLGGQVRQAVAGLAEVYTPDQLKGRLLVVLTNLEPRRIFGEMSEVMILAAAEGETVSVLQPDKPVSPGSRVT